MRHAALLCAASLMLSACTSLSTGSTQPAMDAGPRLQAHRWELVYWEGTAVPHGDNGEPVILSFAEGRISGHTGCNRSSAGYELDAAAMQLRILAPMSTRMACEEGRMAFEAALKLHERELQ